MNDVTSDFVTSHSLFPFLLSVSGLYDYSYAVCLQTFLLLCFNHAVGSPGSGPVGRNAPPLVNKQVEMSDTGGGNKFFDVFTINCILPSNCQKLTF